VAWYDAPTAARVAVGKNLAKAKALGNALLVFLLVPWTLCLLFYTGAGTFCHSPECLSLGTATTHSLLLAQLLHYCHSASFGSVYSCASQLMLTLSPPPGLHYTYPRDRQRIARLEAAGAAAAAASPDPERQRLWTGDASDAEVSIKICQCEKGKYGTDTTRYCLCVACQLLVCCLHGSGNKWAGLMLAARQQCRDGGNEPEGEEGLHTYLAKVVML